MFQTNEKYERRLKSLQLELMNLGSLKDKLERQLLYDKLSPGAEKLIKRIGLCKSENATSQNFIN
jgi:hypothetical protein